MAPRRTERHPRAKGGALDGYTSMPRVAAEQVRRRREAARRLPALDSGQRDPLYDLAALPIRADEPCSRGQLGPGGTWLPCCGRGVA